MTQPTPGDTPPPNGGASEPRDDDDARAPDAPEPPLRGGADERPIPIGCHPMVFGVVMATIQLVLTIVLLRSC